MARLDVVRPERIGYAFPRDDGSQRANCPKDMALIVKPRNGLVSWLAL